jgi:hypothetical protein
VRAPVYYFVSTESAQDSSGIGVMIGSCPSRSGKWELWDMGFVWPPVLGLWREKLQLLVFELMSWNRNI